LNILSSVLGNSVPAVQGPLPYMAVYETGTMGGYSCTGSGNPPPICALYDSTNGYQGRHTSGANFWLADGHSKFFRGGAVSPGANAASSTNFETINSGVYDAAGTESNQFGITFSTN